MSSEVAGTILQGVLITFYSLLLRVEPLSEKLKVSSLIMMMAGVGGCVGGQVVGWVNDKMGGSRSVGRFNIVAHIVVALLFLLCTYLDAYNSLCYITVSL